MSDKDQKETTEMNFPNIIDGYTKLANERHTKLAIERYTNAKEEFLRVQKRADTAHRYIEATQEAVRLNLLGNAEWKEALRAVLDWLEPNSAIATIATIKLLRDELLNAAVMFENLRKNLNAPPQADTISQYLAAGRACRSVLEATKNSQPPSQVQHSGLSSNREEKFERGTPGHPDNEMGM